MTSKPVYTVNKKLNSLFISFASSMEEIEKVDQETRDFLKNNKLSSEIFSVSLVMREGLTNAVRHGHLYNPQKIISYSLKFQDNVLIMEIEDQGEGFDWKAAQNQEMELSADHGRGLPIMNQYFTEYRYNEKGNKLTLIKNLSTS